MEYYLDMLEGGPLEKDPSDFWRRLSVCVIFCGLCYLIRETQTLLSESHNQGPGNIREYIKLTTETLLILLM